MHRQNPVRALLAVAVVAIASITVPLAAEAESRKPNRIAGKLDKMGKKASKARNWDDGNAAFEAAYEADPLPRSLDNLGRRYDKKAEYAEAIEQLHRYLEAVPDADDKDETDARIKLIEVKLNKHSGFVRVETPPVGAWFSSTATLATSNTCRRCPLGSRLGSTRGRSADRLRGLPGPAGAGRRPLR